MKAVLVGFESTSIEVLQSALSAEGITPRPIDSPQLFFRNLHEFSAALIVMRWPLPEELGESVLHRMRDLFRDAIPIVVVGRQASPGDAVAALQSGADDFIAIDTPGSVIGARVRALLRRYASANTASQRVRFGDYQVEYRSRTVTLQGEPIALTPKELDLFWVFITNFERLLPKAELMACVWGHNADVDTHTVSQHVYALRRKLRLERNGLRLAAVYGAGYRLERRSPALGPPLLAKAQAAVAPRLV